MPGVGDPPILPRGGGVLLRSERDRAAARDQTQLAAARPRRTVDRATRSRGAHRPRKVGRNAAFRRLEMKADVGVPRPAHQDLAIARLDTVVGGERLAGETRAVDRAALLAYRHGVADAANRDVAVAGLDVDRTADALGEDRAARARHLEP